MERENQPLPERAPKISRRSLTLSITMLTTAVLMSGMTILPTTYVVRGAGPTFDALGESGGQPLITIKGAPTFETSGQLRLTTVSAAGTPDRPVPLGRLIKGWVSSSESVYPVEAIFTRGQTQEEVNEANRIDMITSQETATVAALTELGFTVPATLTIVGTVETSKATGLVEENDVITSLDGVQIVTYQQLVDALGEVEPGAVVTLGLDREGQPVEVDITTIDGHDDSAYLGVLINPDFDFPVDVSLQIDNVGGASAGTIFALGIIDQLTEEDEANGQVIAGTGTMSMGGEVGPIGGIRYKMIGALRDGATAFLAPQGNCDEVAGHVPDGLEVFAVDTLTEARAAVDAIGRDATEGLATCGPGN